MQLEKGVREGPTVCAAVDHGTIFQPRKMPKVSKSAPVLFIEERSDLLTQTCHKIGFGFATSFRAGERFHLTSCQQAPAANSYIRGATESPMKYLATSPDG